MDPADIVREARVHHASRVVLVHNHPSGEGLGGVSVLDRIIVSGDCDRMTYASGPWKGSSGATPRVGGTELRIASFRH
ncbi:JAB domain-containing protein [Candidatus Cryosericum hinesii]|uniref:JAB domain-containing protein n=1 Tax=Candidatus Cryosericum hinesii TaxID=2290915 RepID=UPI001A9DB0B6